METSERYARHDALFGTEGQNLIAGTTVGVVGLGGTGSHVVQQLAYLGVERYVVVDGDRVEASNLNRLIGASEADAAHATPKTVVAARTLHGIQPAATINLVSEPVEAQSAALALDEADVVFACVDDDLTRLHIIDITSGLGVPSIDIASDVGRDALGAPWYGGRVFVNAVEGGCLSCADLLDQDAISRLSMTPDQRETEARIYGVDPSALTLGGPSVVSINGVVASLAVTEFLVLVTGLRAPYRHLVYRGDLGAVHRNIDPVRTDCYYCATRAAQAVSRSRLD